MSDDWMVGLRITMLATNGPDSYLERSIRNVCEEQDEGVCRLGVILVSRQSV
jgi:hypothetical protein